MAGYMPAQALLKTLLLTCASFSAGDVTESDFSILDRGRPACCVLFPGGIPNYDTAGRVREHQWEAILDLAKRFTSDADWSTFGALRDEVVAKLDATKALSADYFIVNITTDGDPDKLTGPAGAIILQTLRITINEQV